MAGAKLGDPGGVETLVRFEYKEFLGLVLHLKLKVGLAEVDLGESLSADERCKGVNLW